MSALLAWLGLTTFAWSDVAAVAMVFALESLLMGDNVVALALIVRRLPRAQQGKALRYGIVGAYACLFAALVLASWIVRQWWLKAAGGAYLVYLAVHHFARGDHDEARRAAERAAGKRILGLSPFWSAVLIVELTDLAFSVDSIAAAVAMSRKLWVLLLGSMLAILVMRVAARGFVRLLERFPRLEASAFAAVAVVGLKLLVEFPLDVVGRTQPLPPDAAYATADEYAAEVDEHDAPVLEWRGLITVNRASAEAPRRARFADALEFARARDEWLHQFRPAVHIDEWALTALIALIIATGFIHRRLPPPAPSVA